jgi:acetyl-CoA acetyltransferase
MHETGATARHFAMIAVKAHEYGARNPNAQLQNRITIEEVMRSRMVADPLTLYMCCPTGDGAAAAIVTSEKRARELGAKAVKIEASVLQSGLYKTGFRFIPDQQTQIAEMLAGGLTCKAEGEDHSMIHSARNQQQDDPERTGISVATER